MVGDGRWRSGQDWGRRRGTETCGALSHVGVWPLTTVGCPLGFQSTTDSGYTVIHDPLTLAFTDDMAGPSGRLHYRGGTNLANDQRNPARQQVSCRGTAQSRAPVRAHEVCGPRTACLRSPGRLGQAPSPTARAGSAHPARMVPLAESPAVSPSTVGRRCQRR